MSRWPEGHVSKRTCPDCMGPKDFYAERCRPCSPKPVGLSGVTGPAHPAWKGGQMIDRDGYIRTYDPRHPWPRKGGYILEHVRVMELLLGRRLEPGEAVHHIDHDRQNNALANLTVMRHGEHSAHHRKLDIQKRSRDERGRFAGGDA